MALKGNREELQTDMSHICNDVVEQGQVLLYKTPGSGINLDDASNVVELKATPSSGGSQRPAGLCLTNVVSIDTTRQHVNFHKDEVTTGSHVTLLKQGLVVTNKIVASMNCGAGDIAYVAYSGLLVNVANGGTYQRVGEFLGAKDPDGYVKVAIHLPY